MSGRRTFWNVPSCPILLGIFGSGSLVVLVGHPPGMSLVVPGLLGIFGPGTTVVMSGRISRDVPGLLQIFGPGTMVVMSQVVPGLLGIFGLMSVKTFQDVLSVPKLLGSLDLGLW